MTRFSPSSWWPYTSRDLGLGPRLSLKKRIMMGMGRSWWSRHFPVTGVSIVRWCPLEQQEKKSADCFWERFFSLTKIHDIVTWMCGIRGIILPPQVSTANMLRATEETRRKNLCPNTAWAPKNRLNLWLLDNSNYCPLGSKLTVAAGNPTNVHHHSGEEKVHLWLSLGREEIVSPSGAPANSSYFVGSDLIMCLSVNRDTCAREMKTHGLTEAHQNPALVR